MNDNTVQISEHDSQNEHEYDDVSQGDVDINGQLAMGLFIGVIVVLLVVVYAFASAA